MEDGHKDDWKQRSYKYPLKVSLQAVIDRWKNDRVESWTKLGVPKDIQNIIDDLEEDFDSDRPFTKEEIFEMIEKLTKALKTVYKHPAKADSLNDFETVDLNLFDNTIELFKYTKESLEACLAESAIDKVAEGAQRMLLFIDLFFIRGINLSQAVIDFLRLVTRCYIWGFDAECIVLCRSAMEKAIKDKLMCEKRLGKKQYYTLKHRIEVAKREGLIDDNIAKIADGIRDRGNTVVHKDPKATKLVSQTIHETIRVISVVTGEHDPFGTPDWLKDME